MLPLVESYGSNLEFFNNTLACVLLIENKYPAKFQVEVCCLIFK